MASALAALLGAMAWATAPATAEPAAPAPAPVYGVYYRTDDGGLARQSAIQAANLLGRFGKAVILPLDAYKRGDLAKLAGAVVLSPGAGTSPCSCALLADVLGERPVVWLEGGDGSLPRLRGAEIGIRLKARASVHAREVVYKGHSLDRSAEASPLPFRLAVSGEAQVLAEGRGDGAPDPWAIKSGKLIYVAERPFSYATETDRYLAFADLLYEAFAPATPERHRAMARIEDVGPEADPARLRQIADLFHAKGAPFSVTVIDAYHDTFGHYHHGEPVAFTLADRPEVVAALKYMQSRGGTLIMHGHTHQADGFRNPLEGVSGGDYEFIRATLGPDGAYDLVGALPDDGIEHWRARIDEGLAIWRAAGLEAPQLFTTPHYAATPSAYAAIQSRFPVRYERGLYFGDPARPILTQIGQFFPYETVDVRGTELLPEDLGYYSPDDGGQAYRGGSVGRLLTAADDETVVRDGFASFFFHWYADPEALARIVDGLKAKGYRFVSPAEVVSDAPAYFPSHADPKP